MGAWRGEYTDAEWLQMAACLLGPPLVAVFAAWFTKEIYPGRNLMRCVLGGLAAAAFIGLLFFAPFVLWTLVFRGGESARFLWLFDQFVGWGVAAAAIVGAAAGVRYSAHAEHTRQHSSQAVRLAGGGVSLRQFFLLQLLPFVVLGCWVGMRSVALSASPGLERAQRKWSARGWEVHTDANGNLLGLTRIRPSGNLQEKEENAALRDASRERWLVQLKLGVLDDPEAIDFVCLANTPSLKQLHLVYGDGSRLSTKHWKALASLPSVETLLLKSAGSHSESLAPLCASTKLRRLTMESFTIAPKDFHGLKACKSLKALSISDLTPTSLEPLEFPESLEALTLSTRYLWTLNADNFRTMKNLRQVTMPMSGVTKEEIAAIASAPQLETLHLGGVNNPDDLQLLLESSRLKSLRFGYRAKGKDSEAARGDSLLAAIEQLAVHPTLSRLECDTNLLAVKPGGMGSLPANQAPTETSKTPAVMFGAVGMGPAPLDEPKIAEVQARIAALREERGLGKLELHFSSNAFFSTPIRVRYVRPNVRGGRP